MSFVFKGIKEAVYKTTLPFILVFFNDIIRVSRRVKGGLRKNYEGGGSDLFSNYYHNARLEILRKATINIIGIAGNRVEIRTKYGSNTIL
jgi:hypothetical protein